MARKPARLWQVERTPHYRRWYESLGSEDKKSVDGTLRYLRRYGPALPRPFADSVKGSRHHNMKELRARQSVRILFAFDGRRHALLLVGGDKRGQSKRWYRQHVRLADRLLDEHHGRVERETGWRQSPARAGTGRAR